MEEYVADGKGLYRVRLDERGEVAEARIRIEAHDKVPVWRRVWHPTTLARLAQILRPVSRCPHCGQETR